MYDKKQAFVLDVGEELGVYLERPKPYVPTKTSTRGKTSTNYICDAKPVLIKDLIKQIPDEQWETITHRQGTKGSMVRKAAVIDVYI